MENLGIDIRSFLFQLINFGIILFILNKLLYKRVIKTLGDRRSKIDQSLQDAHKIETRLKEVEAEIEAKLNQATLQSNKILEQTKKQAMKVQASLQSQAQQNADKIIQEAKKTATTQKDQIFKELQSEVITLAQQATQKILQDYLTEDEQQKIIKKSLKSIK